MGNCTVEGPNAMCYALFGVRGPAAEAKRPLRVNDHPENSRTGRPRLARERFVHDYVAGAVALLIAGMTVIEIGEITYPFIACAAGIVSLVAMRAAANRAAQGA